MKCYLKVTLGLLRLWQGDLR